jgi:hypothetical protein
VKPDAAPVFTTLPTPPIIVDVGQTYTQMIAATDADGDALTFSAQLPDWLTLINHGDGTATLTGTPPPGANSLAPLDLTVSDGTTRPANCS